MPSTLPTALRAFVVCALSAAAPAMASERIAVLEFTGSSIAEDVRRALTDRTRGAALKPARKVGYDVMTRESTALVIQQMGGQCLEGQCEIELARTIGAALLVTGDARKLDAAYLADLKLHDTEKGTLLAVEALRGSDELDLLEQTAAATERLFAAGFEQLFGRPVEVMRRRGANRERPLGRYYLEGRLGQRLAGAAPLEEQGVESTNPLSGGVRAGRRLDRSWAVELAFGGGSIFETDPANGSGHVWSDAPWVTAAVAWRPAPAGPARFFSAAAEVGVAFVAAGVRPPGVTMEISDEFRAPTAALEARFDYPLGPFALGIRTGTMLMWNATRRTIPADFAGPGAGEEWLSPGVFSVFSVSGAVQYTLPF